MASDTTLKLTMIFLILGASMINIIVIIIMVCKIVQILAVPT